METFVATRAICTIEKENDPAARSTSTTVGATLAIIAVNHAAQNEVCYKTSKPIFS